mmetsp:Transcript_95731/g.252995  ORF Transcript_95731/g.252995 Transcript_95731/m.252995 type:complete len:422 (-) Transcript_95731:69-1334(-)
MLDLILLLLVKLRYHLVDLLLDLGEGIQLRTGGQEGQLRRTNGRRSADQDGGRAAKTLFHLAHGGDLHEGIHGLVEALEGGVVIQDLDGVLHGGDLLQTVLDTLVELLITGGALFLQVREEGPVDVELLLGVLQFLEGLSMLLLELRDLLVEFGHEFPAGTDLILLGGLQLREILRILLLLGLRLGEVLLEVLLHLAQNAKDLPALGRMALIARDGQEGGGTLRLHQEGPEGQHVRGGHGVVAQLHDLRALQMLRDGADLREAGRGDVVLAQDSECLVAGLDGLDEVHLLGVEDLVVLHAQGAGLLEGGLVSVDLVQGFVALGLQLIHLRLGLAQEGLERGDFLIAGLDGRGLLTVVGLAPAGELLVHGLVVVEVLLQLSLHVLEQPDHLHHGSLLEIAVREAGSAGRAEEENLGDKLRHA